MILNNLFSNFIKIISNNFLLLKILDKLFWLILKKKSLNKLIIFNHKIKIHNVIFILKISILCILYDFFDIIS